MKPNARMFVCLAILTFGLGARAVAELSLNTPRPLLKAPPASLPLEIGDWIGHDEPLDPEIAKKSQADLYLNRVYEDLSHPGRKLVLWINYSRHGLNLRHSPEVCLPSGGWTKVESASRTFEIAQGAGPPHKLSLLGYRRGELVRSIGFWYYIFGESSVERVFRGLPITSKSSHGRTTRGSGLTVEIFMPGLDRDSEKSVLDFAELLLSRLDAILPDNRAAYHRP